MKQINRTISLLLVLTLLLTCVRQFPMKARAASITASGNCGDGLSWTLDDAGTLTISGTGAMKNYVSSSTVPWFSSRKTVRKAVVENGVTTVGDHAFSSCTSLTTVEIPESVTTIGNWVFDSCSGLIAIEIDPNNKNYCDIDGVLFSKDQKKIVCYPGGKSGAYSIPNSVTTIGDYAFYKCTGLTSVTIGDSITTIGGSAFYGCTGLTSATIGKAVTTIGDSAFEFCNLTSVTIPNSVTTIGEAAFMYCTGLTSVTISDSATTIGDYAFYRTVLENIYFGGSAPTIGEGVFTDVTATAYYYPDESWTEDVMQDYGGTITWAALEKASVTLEPSAKEVKQGSTFTVDAHLNNSSDIRLGTVVLDYDKNALELVGGTCHMEGANPGTVVVDKKAGTFFLDEAAAVSGKLFTFTFKVKDSAALGEYSITVQAAIGLQNGEAIDASGTTVSVVCSHSYGNWEKLDEDQHKRTCTVCKAHTETIPHSWNNGVITKPATCTEDAIKTYTCTGIGCGATKDEVVTGGAKRHNIMGKWEKLDDTYHQRVCTLCKTYTESEKHTFGENHICTDCGYKAYTVGDFDGDGLVTDADVIYLLWYTVFPEDYPLNQSGDMDGDGLVTDADVIYLLWHTVFPEDYPLTK